jgi:hypothetical protein
LLHPGIVTARTTRMRTSFPTWRILSDVERYRQPYRAHV